MSQLAVKVEEISKLYRLGKVGTGTLKNDLNRFWYKVRGKEDPYLKIGQTNDRSKKGDSDFAWALKDISFEVNKGEVIGIIGRNGAGKSTLLKIMSKITSPTTGKININGRICSLLEVGTGFHPELTGRENVFMNGAILGMRKWEIQKKFDEILDFAGVEAYIDTPVKRYSSGMIVRLGFAVAAHLEPEILIVDEVLAVGDAEFQKKCLGRMKDISKNDGRTVLFVSHNMAAVKSLCNKGILLKNGLIEHIGGASDCINLYLGGENATTSNAKQFNIEKEGQVKLNQISIKGTGVPESEPLSEDLALELTTDIDVIDEDPSRYHLSYHLNNELGETMFSFTNKGKSNLEKGNNKMTCYFPKNFFQSGSYSLNLLVVQDGRRPLINRKEMFTFTIVDRARDFGVYMGREPGFIRPQFEWVNHTSVQ